MIRQLKKDELPAYDVLCLNDNANCLWNIHKGDVAKCKASIRSTIREDLVEIIDGMIDNMAAGN